MHVPAVFRLVGLLQIFTLLLALLLVQYII